MTELEECWTCAKGGKKPLFNEREEKDFVDRFIYVPKSDKGKRWMPAFLEGAPPEAPGEMSEIGWSKGAVFEHFLTYHFARHARITNEQD